MVLSPVEVAANASGLELEAVQELKRQRWYGKANRLSAQDPVRWDAIDQVAAASRKA
jgi:hypothetical protein